MNKLGLAGLALVAGLGCASEDSSEVDVDKTSRVENEVVDVSQVEGVASKELANALQIVNDEKSRLAHELAPWGEGLGVNTDNRLQGVYCEVSRFEPSTYRHAVEDARQAISEIYAQKGLVVDSFDNESVHTHAKVIYPRALYGGDDVIVCASSVATKILDKEGKRVSTSIEDVDFVRGGGDQ